METCKFRLGRLFDRGTGRTMVCAFDGGLISDVSQGGQRVAPILSAVIDAGADGVLLSPGLLEHCRAMFAHRNAPSVLVRADYFLTGHALPTGVAGSCELHRTLISPAEAAALGADGVVMFLILGNADDSVTADNAQAVARAAREAHRVGLPLIVETVLWGSRIEDQRSPEALTYLNRLAAELGADAVKTPFTGDVETMKSVIANCPVPVLLLGGPRAKSEDQLLRATTTALACGARGVVYGRNVWQAKDPRAAAERLRAIVHGAADLTANG